MTVSSQTNSVTYAGDGATTEFAVPYYFLADEHLMVISILVATGDEVVLVLNSEYTVTGEGNPAGGEVTTVVAPAIGRNLEIRRVVPMTQETDYVSNDAFPAESHERALDKLTMIDQQHSTDISTLFANAASSNAKTLRVPENVPVIANAAARANMLLGFDQSGNPYPVAATAQSATELEQRLAISLSSDPDETRTYTLNNNYNTTNPQSLASINTGGKFDFPNRLGHQIVLTRDTAPLLATYNIPVTFTVSSGQPFRNVIFISKKAGLLEVFEPNELVITGYGTATISVTPNAAKLSGSEEITCWVIGDDDQFTNDLIQNNLQNCIGGYDNIVNRQMSYSFGAHNLITGSGDHQGIYGSTYSVIDADNAYNATLGGQNIQISGIAGYSVGMGEGTRISGSYSFIGGAYSFNGTLSKFAFSWGRSINLLDAEYSFAFGRDQTQNANHSAMWGQGCFNFGNDWAEACGLGAVARNAGARTFAISPTSSGADQNTDLLVRGDLLAAGAWAKLPKIDGVDTIRLRANATSIITGHVVANLTGGGDHYAMVEVKALYNASLGVIGTSFTVIHSLGDGANVQARITTVLGTDTFSIEVRDGVTNRAGSAMAKLEIVEYLKT